MLALDLSGPMEAIVIVVVVLLLAGAVFFLTRRKELPPPEKPAELPREPSKPAAAREQRAEARAEPRAEPKKAEPPQRTDEVAKTAPKAEPSSVAVAPPPERIREPTPAPIVPKPIAKPTETDVAALKKGLASTRGGFVARLAKLFSRKKEIDPELINEIEEVLLTADIGVATTQKLLSRLRERLERRELADEDRVWAALREEALTILQGPGGGLALKNKPAVLLVVGVNGVGKTTTIGKLASRFTEDGKKVILAAGDTFRAAAVLQLEVWGKRVGCPVVKGKDRADPGSVIFDAIKRAQDEGADLVIADTAGRLHTKTPLMEELKKVGRTVEKALDGRGADEIVLVLDATNGQNAIQQAQMFREALPVSSIVLTKLDGTAKGGVVLGIVDEHRIPVRYIGIGERVEDLREFEPSSFVEALLSKPDDESMAA